MTVETNLLTAQTNGIFTRTQINPVAHFAPGNARVRGWVPVYYELRSQAPAKRLLKYR
jgi:hypothetical protein